MKDIGEESAKHPKKLDQIWEQSLAEQPKIRLDSRTSIDLENLKASAENPDCKIKEIRELPCSFGLTGRVHEEEYDRSFSVFLLSNKE